MATDQENGTPPVQSIPLLERISPGIFAAPMGLLGSAHVLRQLSATEGAPFGAASGGVFVAGAVLLIILTVIYGARGLTVRGGLRADLLDPVKMNFGSGFAIAVTLAASGLAMRGLPGATVLLFIGAAASFLFGVIVVRQWLLNPFEPYLITPIWFIPLAGTLVAAKALGDGGFPVLGLLMGGLGFFGWVMMLPFILRRLIIEPELSDLLLPTLFIIIAPPGLAANAALALLPEAAAMPLALLCLGIGLFFLAVLATMFREFERAPFSLAVWSYTFPSAAMASAALSIAVRSEVSGLTLLAHGLASLNMALTLGVSIAALWHLRKR